MNNKKLLNILFCSRADLFTKEGGDTFHILHLQKLLIEFGHTVEIVQDEYIGQIKQFDIVHFFNLSLIDHNYNLFKLAKKHRVKTCFTPIFQNPKYYDFFYPYSWLIPKSFIEKIKQTFYFLTSKISLQSYCKTIFQDQKVIRKRLLLQCDLVFINSTQEQSEIEAHYSIDLSNKVQVIVPTIDVNQLQDIGEEFVIEFNHKDYILIVGRIERLKNQITILDSLEDMDRKVIFIGQANTTNKTYNSRFESKVNDKDHVFHYSKLPRNMVLSAIKNASIVIQASCVENFGLVSLEAHYYQKKLLVSKNSYFNSALKTNYPQVNPYSKSSIKDNVNKLLKDKSPVNLKGFCDPLDIERSFVTNTLAGYLKILS